MSPQNGDGAMHGDMNARRPAALALAILLAIGLLTGCDAGGPMHAQAASQPAELVHLKDGRAINLVCKGRGQPTILLESGFGADSSAWFKVQPDLAKTTQVCAYDRAGYGYSDPGPLPRDGAAVVRDLDEALQAAKIEGPFIVVGHSAGGLYARLFAARRPGEVQGLVLLDTTVEHHAPQPVNDGLDGIRRRLQRCLALTKAQPALGDAELRQNACLSGSNDPHVAMVARNPATWGNRLSELNELFDRTSDQVFRVGGVLHDVPIYVITASETASASLQHQLGTNEPVSITEQFHQQIAASYAQGFQQTVASSHLVMIDRPDVVIASARALVMAAREARAPAPLPPSETFVAPDQHEIDDLLTAKSPLTGGTPR